MEATAPKPVWRRLYEGWLLVAARFGEVQTLILVTLIYALVLGPMATIAFAARKDLLHKRELWRAGSAWRDADSTTNPDVERARRLF